MRGVKRGRKRDGARDSWHSHGAVQFRLVRTLASGTAALGLAVWLLAPTGCATGSDASAPNDGGAAEGSAADAPAGDATGDGGAGTSIQKACNDNASSYCMQLQQCAPFLLTTQYGDAVTCIARNVLACTDALQAPGTGWTGDALEACVAARTALAAKSCDEFLHGKPAPNACRVTGTITTSNACRYDAQCGSGYCRYMSGSSCGTCVLPGATNAPCTTTSDCDGDLVCAGGACRVPVGVGGMCDAMMNPCQQGLACIAGYCAQPMDVGGTCSSSGDCDYDKGLYCDTTSKTCKTYIVAMNGQMCGSAGTACFGGGSCQTMVCVAPVQDGSPCDPTQGADCMPPSTCEMGLCQLYKASMCM